MTKARGAAGAGPGAPDSTLAVRNQLAKKFDIPDDAVIMVNGEVVRPDFVRQKNDILESFLRGRG